MRVCHCINRDCQLAPELNKISLNIELETNRILNVSEPESESKPNSTPILYVSEFCSNSIRVRVLSLSSVRSGFDSGNSPGQTVKNCYKAHT